MQVHTLGALEPGATVSLSTDKTIVRISYPTRDPIFLVLPIDDEQSAKPVHAPVSREFSDLVSLGPDAPRVVLATFRVGRNESPSEEVRRLIAQGVAYTRPALELGDDPQENLWNSANFTMQR